MPTVFARVAPWLSSVLGRQTRRGAVSSFRSDEGGVVAVIFAIVFSAVLLAVAAAIDYARTAREYARTQNALDAATLAASHRLSAMILAGLASSARTQPLNTVIEVECDAFRKNPNGSWTLSRKTVVNHGIYGLILEPRNFQKNDIDVFGFDLVRVLEQNCAQTIKTK